MEIFGLSADWAAYWIEIKDFHYLVVSPPVLVVYSIAMGLFGVVVGRRSGKPSSPVDVARVFE